jgi:hypothetical protein
MEITRKELRELYASMTIVEMCKSLGGITPPRLYRLLDKAGIERKIKNRAPRNPIKITLIDPPLTRKLLAEIAPRDGE